MRGGVSWNVSLHWDDVRSVPEALDTIRSRAAETPVGTWIPSIGGWHRRQLAEGRIPTPAELTAAAPEHPVYIQETYDVGVLNAAGLAACDCALLITDHDAFDYPLILRHAPLIVDSRGRWRGAHAHVVRA